MADATVPVPEQGKVVLTLLTATRSAACVLDLDEGQFRPLVMHAALDECMKGLSEP